MSFVYWLVFFSVLVLGIAAEKNPNLQVSDDGSYRIMPDKGAVFLLSMILILVAGFRYQVGADYWSYAHWNISEWKQVWDRTIHFNEGGFAFLAMLSKLVVNHGQSLIFFSSIITISLYCWTIYRYHAMFLLSILLYIFTGQWQGSFNGVRQCLAAAILFAGHRYILERKLCKYFLVVFIASMFHITAVVMIIPYFLFTRKADLKQIVFLAVGSIILRLSYDRIFSVIEILKDKELNRNRLYMTNDVSIFRVLVTFVPVALYIMVCRKQHQTEEQNFYINSLFFNAFSMLAGMGSAYFGRIGIYTGAMVTIGYGHLFQLIDDERSKKITIFSIMIMFFLYWLYSLMAAGKYIRDYQWIFSHY